eukprot:scaffold2724_cov260-Pinguiococcus_pyrenoidosus.AAC.8
MGFELSGSSGPAAAKFESGLAQTHIDYIAEPRLLLAQAVLRAGLAPFGSRSSASRSSRIHRFPHDHDILEGHFPIGFIGLCVASLRFRSTLLQQSGELRRHRCSKRLRYAVEGGARILRRWDLHLEQANDIMCVLFGHCIFAGVSQGRVEWAERALRPRDAAEEPSHGHKEKQGQQGQPHDNPRVHYSRSRNRLEAILVLPVLSRAPKSAKRRRCLSVRFCRRCGLSTLSHPLFAFWIAFGAPPRFSSAGPDIPQARLSRDLAFASACLAVVFLWMGGTRPQRGAVSGAGHRRGKQASTDRNRGAPKVDQDASSSGLLGLVIGRRKLRNASLVDDTDVLHVSEGLVVVQAVSLSEHLQQSMSCTACGSLGGVLFKPYHDELVGDAEADVVRFESRAALRALLQEAGNL